MKGPDGGPEAAEGLKSAAGAGRERDPEPERREREESRERQGRPGPDLMDRAEPESEVGPEEHPEEILAESLAAPVPKPLELATEERRHAQMWVLLALSAGAALVLVLMLWPFLTAIISATVLAVLAAPLQRRIHARIRHPSVAAFTGTIVLFFVVFLPLVGLSIALFNSIEDNIALIASGVVEFLAPEGEARAWITTLAARLGISDLSVGSAIDNQANALGGFLAGQTVGMVSGLGGGLIQAGVALFTLYYLLRDGPALLDALTRVVPLDEKLTGALIRRSDEIIGATMFGNVAVGVAQGTLGGLTFWVLGLPGAVLWGSVMGVLGLLPAVGTPLVWGPAALILLLDGEVLRAAVLVAAGTLIVSTVDNVLRATVVSDRAQLHPLVVFFSALGGILLFGVMGIFLGPVLFVLSISILEIARRVLEPDQTREDGNGGA